MKKITLKNLLALLLCVVALQTYAQVGFQESTGYRFRTALASPEDYNTSKDAPFANQFVYPTVRSGQNSLTMTPKDTGNNDLQIFAFVPLTGQMVEYPEASGEMRQIYNIVSSIAADGNNGTGVLEINATGENGQRMRLRGNAYPFDNDLGKFIVVPVSSTATESYFQIVAAGTIGLSTGSNRVLGPDTNYEWFNFGGPGGTTRPQFEEWVFETVTGENVVLSNEKFDTSSIFIANPVKNTLSIKGITDIVNQVSVYSILGQEVLTKKVDTQSTLNIDFSSLTSGIYLVKLQGDTGSFIKKIIKE